MTTYFDHQAKSTTWEVIDFPQPKVPRLPPESIVVIEHTIEDAPAELLKLAGIHRPFPGEALIDLL